MALATKRVKGRRTEWTALGGLRHIPLEDVLLRHAGLAQSVDGAGPAAAEGADDNDARQTPSLLGTLAERLLDVGDQGILVGIALNAGEGLAVVQLPGPDFQGKSSTGETGVEAKRLGGVGQK